MSTHQTQSRPLKFGAPAPLLTILAATAFVAALAALLAGWGGIAIAVAVLGAILLAAGGIDALKTSHEVSSRGGDPATLEHDAASTVPSVPADADSASPQTHGGITPHDLPVDHPGREQAEREAAALGGETPGNR